MYCGGWWAKASPSPCRRRACVRSRRSSTIACSQRAPGAEWSARTGVNMAGVRGRAPVLLVALGLSIVSFWADLNAFAADPTLLVSVVPGRVGQAQAHIESTGAHVLERL